MKVQIRASEPWLRRLDALAASRGMNRSQAIRAAVTEAQPDAPPLPPAPDRDELLRLLGAAARSGSVPAIRALLDEERRAEGSGDVPRSDRLAVLSRIDELAARRRAVGGVDRTDNRPRSGP
jgi:hypothetical protein